MSSVPRFAGRRLLLSLLFLSSIATVAGQVPLVGPDTSQANAGLGLLEAISPKPASLFNRNTNGSGSSGKEISTVAPTIVGVQAVDNSDGTFSFNLNVRDNDGVTDLRSIYLLINGTLNGANACFLHFQPDARVVSLANDSASNWTSAPQPIGSSGELRNSSCAVNLQNVTSSAVNPQLLQVSFRIAPLPGFSGTKSVFLLATDSGNLSTQWVNATQVTLSSGTPAPAASPDACCLQSSDWAGNNAERTMEVNFSLGDGDGVTDLRRAYLLINSSLSAANACFLEFDLWNKQVRLANDAGNNWLTPATTMSLLGDAVAPVAATNSKCGIRNGGFSITEMGTEKRLVISGFLQWKEALPGVVRRAYLFAEDAAGRNSGWLPQQEWTVPASGKVAIASLEPVTGQTAPIMLDALQDNTRPLPVFTNSYASIGYEMGDGNGPETLRYTRFAISEDFRSFPACLILYDHRTQKAVVSAEDGLSWKSGNDSSGNARCSMPNSPAVQITPSAQGNRLSGQINLKGEFAFVGSRAVFASAVDQTGRSSGWKRIAVWRIPGPLAPTVSTTTNAGTAEVPSRVFVALKDINGFSNLRSFRVVVTNQTTATAPPAQQAACDVTYTFGSFQQGYMQLASDSGTLGTAKLSDVVVDPAGMLENSQCAVSVLLNWYSENLDAQVSYAMVFKQAFIGVRSVFTMATDAEGLSSGWTKSPDLTVTSVTSNPPAPTLLRSSVTFGSRATVGFVSDWNAPSARYWTYFELRLSPEGRPNLPGCLVRFALPSIFQIANEAGKFVDQYEVAKNPSLGNKRCRPVVRLLSGPSSLSGLQFGLNISPELPGRLDIAYRSGYLGTPLTDWIPAGTYTNPGPTAPLVETTNRVAFSPPNTVISDLSVTEDSGTENLTDGFALWNGTLSNQNACLVWFNFADKTLRLANAEGTAWSTASIPMQSASGDNTLENSNCTFTRANFSQFGQESVRASLSFSFNNSFRGPKQLYTYFANRSGKNTGWVAAGGPVEAVSANAPDIAAAGGAVAGSGSNGKITLRASNVNSIAGLSEVQLLLGTSLTDMNQCTFAYDIASGTLRLLGSPEPQSIQLNNGQPAPTVVETRDCRMYSAGFDVSLERDASGVRAMLVTFSFGLKRLQATPLRVFASAASFSAGSSGWKEIGTWNTDGKPTPLAIPSSAFLSAANGIYPAEFTLSHPSGVSGITNFYFLAGSGSGTVSACFFWVDMQNRVIRLASDAGNAWLATTAQLGTSATGVSNSSCRLASSDWQPNGATGTLRLNLAFNSSFSGSKTLSTNVEAANGLTSGWYSLGSKTLP